MAGKKVFPALDDSDHLIVISTPLAFETIQKDGREEPNWLAREIDHFLGPDEQTLKNRPVDVVVGPGADLKRFPGRLNEFRNLDWVDLRPFSWLRSYGLGSRLDSGVTKLVASLYDVPDRHLPLLYKEEIRQRRQIFHTNALVSLVTLSFVAAIVSVVNDYVIHQRSLDQAYEETTNLVENQEFEHAIRVAIAALPDDYDLPWRPRWSDAKVRKVLAKLANAAQLSAYVGKIEDEKSPIQSIRFDQTGSKLVAASQAGTVSVWNSDRVRRIITCTQEKIFADISYTPTPGSTIWVRDARFGEGSNVLSAGRYGAWAWNSACPGCKDEKDTERCSPRVRMIGHTKDVRTAEFSPNSRWVVTTSDDGTLRVWDDHTGEQRGTIDLPASALPLDYRYTTSADISPDGKLIVVSRRDGLIAIVDFDSHATLFTLQQTGAAVWSVRFDKLGKRVLSASANGEVAIWFLASKTKLTLPRHPSAVSSASFSPDDRFIATTSRDRIVRVWDAGKLTQMVTLKGHEGPVLNADFSPDGKRLATSSDDRTGRLWSLGPDIIPTILHASDYSLVSASLDVNGRHFVTGGFDGRVTLYKVEEDHGITKEHDFAPSAGVITGVSMSTRASKIIVGSNKGAVLLWDGTAEPGVRLTQLPAGDTLVAIDASGQYAATALALTAGEGHSRVWNLQTKASLPLEGATMLKSLEFNDQGTQLIAGSEAATKTGQRLATIWDASTGRRISTFEHNAPVLSAHFSRDGHRVATASLDYKAYAWDSNSRTLLQAFIGHTYDVNSARFSPDAQRIVTASSDRTARVWDVITGAEILRFPIESEAVDAFFTEDGKRILVTTADGDIRDYDVSWSTALDHNLKSRVCALKLMGIDKDNQCAR